MCSVHLHCSTPFMDLPVTPVLVSSCNSIFNTLQKRFPSILLLHQHRLLQYVKKECLQTLVSNVHTYICLKLPLLVTRKLMCLQRHHMITRRRQQMPACFWQVPCEPVKQLPSLKPRGISQMCCTEQETVWLWVSLWLTPMLRWTWRFETLFIFGVWVSESLHFH